MKLFFYNLILIPILFTGEVAHATATEKKTYSTQLEKIIQRKKIVVAVGNGSIPPFLEILEAEKAAPGKFIGLDVAIVKDIAAQLGVTIIWNTKAIDNNQVLEEVANHRADLAISGISLSPSRALKVRFTQPYARTFYAISRNRSANIIQRAAYATGAVYSTFMNTLYPNAQKFTYYDRTLMFNDLAQGKIDVVAANEQTTLHWLSKNPQAGIHVQVNRQSDRPDPKVIAVAWDNSELKEWINRYLDSISSNGTLDRWIQEYFKK